jgi:hypothetical protein
VHVHVDVAVDGIESIAKEREIAVVFSSHFFAIHYEIKDTFSRKGCGNDESKTFLSVES